MRKSSRYWKKGLVKVKCKYCGHEQKHHKEKKVFLCSVCQNHKPPRNIDERENYAHT